jgi:hypothetical protein
MEWEVVVQFEGIGRNWSRGILLRWPQIGRAAGKASFILTDLVTGRRVYIRTQSVYRFIPHPGEKERRFKVVMETGGVGALQIANLRAEPTRGRRIRIHFALSRAATTSVKVLTLTGRVVAVVEAWRNRPTGTQSLLWDGRDAQGRPVPPGVYLLRVEAEDEEGRRMQTMRAIRMP